MVRSILTPGGGTRNVPPDRSVNPPPDWVQQSRRRKELLRPSPVSTVVLATEADARNTFSSRSTLPFLGAVFGLAALTLGMSALLRLASSRALAPAGVLLVVVGDFAPMLCAIAFCRARAGGAGVRALFRQLAPARVAARWYPIALLHSAAILIAAFAVYAVASGRSVGPWLYPPSDGLHVTAMLLVPFADQIGWRGFAYPRLRQRYGVLGASLLLGAIWAAWHISKQGLFLGGVPLGLLPALVGLMIGGNMVFSWIYERTGQSLLMVVLAHMGVYLDNSAQALPGNTLPVTLHAAGYCVVALALVLVDRAVWRVVPAGRRG